MKVQVEFPIFAKGIEASYAFCEPFQNSISSIRANEQTDGDLLMEVVENDGAMTVSIKDNGTGISKSRIPEMMNIGKKHSSHATVLNENGAGLKGYVALNDPTETGWNIRVRNQQGEMFKISGPWMNYEVEDIEEWQDGDYNFIVETPVTEEDTREFYRNITADYIRWQFLFEDCTGWKLVKNINGKTERYNIPMFNLDSNPAVRCHETSFVRKHVPCGDNGGFYLTIQFFDAAPIDNMPAKNQTIKQKQIKSADPQAYLFGITNYASQNPLNLARKKTGLLFNKNAQGIYIFQNGRFNDHVSFDFANRVAHGALNGKLMMVNVETYCDFFFPSDANKRKFREEKQNGILIRDKITLAAHDWLLYQAGRKKEAVLRDGMDTMMRFNSKMTGNHYDTEVCLDSSKLRMDAVYINNEMTCIVEYKAEPIAADHVIQVEGYFHKVLHTMLKKYGDAASFNADSDAQFPRVFILGTPKNLVKGGSYVKAEALAEIETWKEEMAMTFPNKELHIELDNMLDYTNHLEVYF